MVIHAGGRGPGHIARSNVDPPVVALRALAASGGQYPAMSSPPTATLGTSGAGVHEVQRFPTSGPAYVSVIAAGSTGDIQFTPGSGI